MASSLLYGLVLSVSIFVHLKPQVYYFIRSQFPGDFPWLMSIELLLIKMNFDIWNGSLKVMTPTYLSFRRIPMSLKRKKSSLTVISSWYEIKQFTLLFQVSGASGLSEVLWSSWGKPLVKGIKRPTVVIGHFS